MEEQPPGLEVLSRRAQVFPDDTHGFARAANLLLEVGKNEKQSAGVRPSRAWRSRAFATWTWR